MDQHIIRRDAGLSGVDELALGYPFTGKTDIGALADDSRTLAAELQSDWSEMLRGGLHHDFPDPRTAGEEDVVETAP